MMTPLIMYGHKTVIKEDRFLFIFGTVQLIHIKYMNIGFGPLFLNKCAPVYKEECIFLISRNMLNCIKSELYVLRRNGRVF